MKYILKVLVVLMLNPSIGLAQSLDDQWKLMISEFQKEYKQLNLSSLRLAYIDNLEGIKDLASIEQQKKVFNKLKLRLGKLDRKKLNSIQQIEFDLLQYYLSLNEERIDLEEKWLANPLDSIPSGGLATVPNGQSWYTYFLKRWIDQSVTPEDLFKFGLSEVNKVKNNMKAIQQKSGKDSLAFQKYIESNIFYYEEVATIQAAFEQFHERLIKLLPQYFPRINAIPKVKIQRGTNVRLAQVPGFYRGNTFYYNFFEEPFNKRQIPWLYLHEALPGHHYEINYSRSLEKLPTQELFYYPGYSEGWAAYVEEIGYEIGAYQNIYDELGKWEWDIIRSVRVPLDVGLNYYAWSDEQAMVFWRQHIQGKDDIGRREIARMKRWPCQVITYKYGANKILKWKAKFEEAPDFSLKTFHEKLLGYGPLPFSILEHLIIE